MSSFADNMGNFLKERLGERRYNELLQETEGKTYEEVLDERDTWEARWNKLKYYVEKMNADLYNNISVRNILQYMNELEDEGNE